MTDSYDLTDILQYVNEWSNENKTMLIEKYDEMNLRASGQWAESLKQTTQDTGDAINTTMTGEDYTVQITEGRAPNSDQSPGALQAFTGWAGSTFIKEWVNDKGLNLNPYAVARNIAVNGWKSPNSHNTQDVVSAVLTDARKKELMDKLGKDFQMKVNNYVKYIIYGD